MSCPVTRVCAHARAPTSTALGQLRAGADLPATLRAQGLPAPGRCQGIGNRGTILSADARGGGGGRAGDGGEREGGRL